MPPRVRQVTPRRPLAGADLETLAGLGLADAPVPPPEVVPAPGAGRRARLRAALAEVADGQPLDADEEAALEALVRLPAGAVDQVVRWIRRARKSAVV